MRSMKWMGMAAVTVMAAIAGCGDQSTTAPGKSPAADVSLNVANAGTEANVTGHADYLLTTVANAQARYSFSAERHRSGDVKGQLEYKTSLEGGTTIHGEVECVEVTGNTARLAARITKSNTASAPEGMFLVWEVADNGEGKNSPPDLTSTLFLLDQTTALRECLTSFLPFGPLFAVNDGNIQVHQSGR